MFNDLPTIQYKRPFNRKGTFNRIDNFMFILLTAKIKIGSYVSNYEVVL